jgi:hypothetical protein
VKILVSQGVKFKEVLNKYVLEHPIRDGGSTLLLMHFQPFHNGEPPMEMVGKAPTVKSKSYGRGGFSI